MSDYNSLKIDELKELLKERGLSTTGRKQQLVQALIDDDSKNSKSNNSETAGVTSEPMDTEKEEPTRLEASSESEMKVDQEMQVRNTTSQTICISDVNQLSEKERIELRRQKFGVCKPTTEAEKRLARSKRFGTVSEDEKRRLRQERFGTVSKINDPDYEKKIQARKLRFGLK